MIAMDLLCYVHSCTYTSTGSLHIYMWQSQVENEHYSTLSGPIQLVISLECFIETTPDFLYLFMN